MLLRTVAQPRNRAAMQDDDLEDEEDEYEESEDGFVVPNGYISEDEGLGSVQQSLNDLCADLEGTVHHLCAMEIEACSHLSTDS